MHGWRTGWGNRGAAFRVVLFAGAVASAGFLSGCKRTATPPPVLTTEPAAAPADLLVLGTVGKETLSLGAVRATAAQNNYDLHDARAADLALRDTVNFELLAAEAERRGLFNDPAIRRLVRNMAVQRLVQDQVDAALSRETPAAPEDLRAYYDAHPAEFSQPTLVKGQLLFLLRRAGQKPEEFAARRLKIEETLAGGTGFGEAVRQLSDSPAARADGGLTGWLIQGQANDRYPPEVAAALFELRDPAAPARGPVETSSGLYWVRLAERRDGSTTPFDEARGALRVRVEQQRRQALYDRYVEGLRRQFPVTVYPERLQAQLSEEAGRGGPPAGPVRTGR